jgi:hypothetical protein
MADRELVFALFGLLGSCTDSVLLSLQLLNREIPVATITGCKEEMNSLARNLATLSEPQAKAFIREILDEIRSRNKDD